VGTCCDKLEADPADRSNGPVTSTGSPSAIMASISSSVRSIRPARLAAYHPSCASGTDDDRPEPPRAVRDVDRLEYHLQQPPLLVPGNNDQPAPVLRVVVPYRSQWRCRPLAGGADLVARDARRVRIFVSTLAGPSIYPIHTADTRPSRPLAGVPRARPRQSPDTRNPGTVDTGDLC
jgi:hypothetical protein